MAPQFGAQPIIVADKTRPTQSAGDRTRHRLQGQMSPAINYAKDLIAEGYAIDRGYQADFANRANLLIRWAPRFDWGSHYKSLTKGTPILLGE